MIRAEVALHPKPFALAVLGAMVYAAATIATSWALGRVVDEVVVPRFEGNPAPRGTVVVALLGLALIGLLRAGAIVVRRGMAVVTQARVDSSLREEVVRQYGRLPYAYHASHPTGQLLAHANADTEAAAAVMAPLPFCTGVVALVLATVAWLVATDVYLAVVGLLLLPALLFLNAFYQRRMEGPATLVQERVGVVSAVAHESIDGALVVKTLGAEASEGERFTASTRSLRDAKLRAAQIRATFDAVLEALPTLGVIAVIVVGAWRIDQEALSPGTLVSFVSLLTLLSWPLQMIGFLLAELPRSVAGFTRVQEVADEGVPAPPSGRRRLPDGPLALSVRGVSFAHELGRPMLDEVSFEVPAGATVALVGPTGAGKSTLLAVLARLLPHDRGHVELGGVDLAEVAGDELSGACAMAFQEPFLFGASIEENVVLGRDLGPGALRSALELAGATEFVDRLEGGVETVVGERGATLSGGQRQRIALARALAGAPRLLLLDDATSAVDPVTEAEILLGLGRRLRATTTLVVANRPSTLALADSVVFLDHGRVVAAGSSEELMETPAYERLVRAYESDRVFR